MADSKIIKVKLTHVIMFDRKPRDRGEVIEVDEAFGRALIQMQKAVPVGETKVERAVVEPAEIADAPAGRRK